MKVAVLFRNLGPYHHARLRSLAARFDVSCMEFARQDDEYGWPAQAPQAGYRVHTVAAKMPQTAGDLARARRGMAEALGADRPDAVAIPGWSEPLSLAALQTATALSIPTVLMSDSTAEDAPRRAAVEYLKRRIVGRFSSAFVAGTRQSAYLQALGRRLDDISLGYDVVDNAHFAAGADAARAQAETVRRAHNLPDRYVVCCARLLARKNILALLRAFRTYRDAVGSDAWTLVLVGDGPMRAEIAAEARRLEIDGVVRLLGSRGYDELPAIYGLAAAFVLPSLVDQWGLAVNEAMAAGLPVLVSSACGCAPDLLEEGVNGYTFDPADEAALACALERLARAPDLTAFGAASRRIVAAWNLDRFVAGMSEAVDTAIRRGSRPAGAFDRALIEAGIRR